MRLDVRSVVLFALLAAAALWLVWHVRLPV